MAQELEDVISRFLEDPIKEVKPIDEGLINRSFLVETASNRYILQRINKEIFGNAGMIMENIDMVHSHLKRITGYHIPQITRTLSGQLLHEDENGFSWRMMLYIPNSQTFSSTDDPVIASEVGRVIGSFHAGLKGLDPNSLHIIIPDFHDLNFRADLFLGSLQNAKRERLREASTCIPQAEQFIDEFETLLNFTIPTRVTHNDTKLNNILFSKDSKTALCLIDLDTLMPGHIHHDFGDAVRTLCSTATEEEKDLSLVGFNMSLFNAFSAGYLKQMGAELVEDEWRILPSSVELMPFIMGLRFLTDYLYDDVYYKVKYPGQNLDRCKNQFELVEKVRMQRGEIEKRIMHFKPR